MTEVNEVNFSKGGKMAEGEGAKGRSGLIRMIVIGGVVILALAIVVGVLYWFFFMHSANQKASRAGGNEGAQTGETLQESIKNPLYVDLGSFTVNLAEGRRYARVSMKLLTTDKEAADTLTKRVAELQDIVVTVLRQKTVETLNDPNTQLDQDILKRIEKQVLPRAPNEYRKLLITEFLIQ